MCYVIFADDWVGANWNLLHLQINEKNKHVIRYKPFCKLKYPSKYLPQLNGWYPETFLEKKVTSLRTLRREQKMERVINNNTNKSAHLKKIKTQNKTQNETLNKNTEWIKCISLSWFLQIKSKYQVLDPLILSSNSSLQTSVHLCPPIDVLYSHIMSYSVKTKSIIRHYRSVVHRSYSSCPWAVVLAGSFFGRAL